MVVIVIGDKVDIRVQVFDFVVGHPSPCKSADEVFNIASPVGAVSGGWSQVDHSACQAVYSDLCQIVADAAMKFVCD
jgi:hypothetical protein